MVHRSYKLANHIFFRNLRFYQSEPYEPRDFVRLRIDPIREAAYLLITAAFDGVWEETSVVEYIESRVRELRNIPESIPLDMLQMARVPSNSIQIRPASKTL